MVLRHATQPGLKISIVTMTPTLHSGQLAWASVESASRSMPSSFYVAPDQSHDSRARVTEDPDDGLKWTEAGKTIGV